MTPEFPHRVVLVDTGERRYPKDWETYLFYDDTRNTVAGPFTSEFEDRSATWSSRPEHYAIYDAQPWSPATEVSEGL